jgi:hypothetical protein
MKYLLIFLILAALVIWLSWRFRRQIAVARQVWKMLLEANRRMNSQPGTQAPPQKIPAGKLVRCEKCQTWVPKDTALGLGANTYFCSANCMEKAVASE